MNTDPIKQKIQELCPDVMEPKFFDLPEATVKMQKIITLAVVLRAIQKLFREGTLQGGYNNTILAFGDTAWRWNLEHDNYDAQTRETQLFIGSLLNI